MDYKQILDDPIVRAEYAKIDDANKLPFNHGMKHVLNVVDNMDKLTDLLEISGDEKEYLMISSVLHDIGQVESRENHGAKGRVFAEEYLEGKIPDESLEQILSAIEFHSQRENQDELPLSTILLLFADKIDFTRDRLDDNWRQKVDPSKLGSDIYEKILSINFDKTEREFIVSIKTDGHVTVNDLKKAGGFFDKVVGAVSSLSKKLGLQPKITIDGMAIDYV